MKILIVEDQPNDFHIASETAYASGFSAIEPKSSATAAQAFLVNALEGEESLPDAILLDLDLGYESGFELLRFWHGNPRLCSIPLVVWSILGDRYREICRMFHITAYVYKGDDVSLLRQVLSGLPGRRG